MTFILDTDTTIYWLKGDEVFKRRETAKEFSLNYLPKTIRKGGADGNHAYTRY